MVSGLENPRYIYEINTWLARKYSLSTSSGAVIVTPMDISLLKTFLCVARTRHFGKAAETLFVTQSAVSARVKLLESTLGAQLFTRDRNNIQLTAAGERLRRHADMLVQGWERARLDVALESRFTQSLAIGTSTDLWHIGTRDWIDNLCRTHTDLTLHLEISKTDSLINQVLEGILDLAFVFEHPTTTELVARQLTRIPLVLVSSEPEASCDDALRDNYILVDWGRSFSITHAAFVEDRCLPRVHSSTGGMALDLLLSRGGSCYLAQQMVEPYLDAGKLFLVSGAPCIERYAYAVFRSESECSEMIRDIISSI
jgi:LysR family transcriptional regulator, flagellar master operon regulator